MAVFGIQVTTMLSFFAVSTLYTFRPLKCILRYYVIVMRPSSIFFLDFTFGNEIKVMARNLGCAPGVQSKVP